MLTKPRVSVIVPCYNQGEYLEETLNSVYEQSLTDWECIVVNDGSEDDTELQAKKRAGKDARFKYVYKKNGGLSSARNKGLELATGEYIQFLDADDKINREKFRMSLNCTVNPDVILTNFSMFSESGESAMPPYHNLNSVQFAFRNILLGWDDQFVIPIHCGLFNRRLFSDIRFNEKLKAKEDWLVWLQIYLKPVQTVFVDQPHALYRYTGKSMSQNRKHMHANLVVAYQEIYRILPSEYKDAFFLKAVKTLGEVIQEADLLFEKTRASKSYRIGNFFVRNANKIFKQ